NDRTAAELAAIETDVIRTDAGGQRFYVEKFRVPLVDLEPELARLRVPVEGEEAGKLLHALHLVCYRLSLHRRSEKQKRYEAETPHSFVRGGRDFWDLHGWSFHSGMRPGVHGAPAASSCFSSRDRSTSINWRNCESTPSNSCAAAVYWFCCVCVGREVDMRCAPTTYPTRSLIDGGVFMLRCRATGS